MKTAVSLPDELFLRADAFAKKTGRSRSQLYADALREFLRRRDDDEITEQMNLMCREVDTSLDEVYRRNAARMLEDEGW